MKKKFILLCLILLSLEAPAFGLPKSLGGASNGKCTQDIQKFCMSVMTKDRKTIMKCLQDHMTEISSSCKSLLVSQKK